MRWRTRLRALARRRGEPEPATGFGPGIKLVAKCSRVSNTINRRHQALFAEWRDIVDDMENLAVNPNASAQDVQEARSRLRALLGPVTLARRDGVLWANPPRTQKASSKRGFQVGSI